MARIAWGGRKETITRKLDCLLTGNMGTGIKRGEASLFQMQLRECFLIWKEVSGLRGREQRANMILTGFCAREKIRSRFQDFLEYVEEEMEEEESSEGLVTAGFNSCMNLAWIDYRKLQEQLRALSDKEKKTGSREERIDFLQMLSYKNSFFSELYTAYMAGLKCGKQEGIKENDRKTYALARKVNASIAGYNKEAEGRALGAVIEDLELQKEKITRTIAEAKGLEAALAGIMNEENMKMLRDKGAETETLKQKYREIGEKVRSVLER